MKSVCNMIFAALLASSVTADASRVGQKIKYVYQISAQGSHTPSSSLGYAAEGSLEPSQLSYVTPLGIRQQYMIGNELRYRYVEDLKNEFMAEKYDITQTFIQTSWNDTAILSSQAMMLGFYPPGENNYVLTEEQKYNAVPPIDNFDFKPWIDEMGLEALPHQTTIFPIQMNGWSYDYMLATDNENCAARGAARAKLAEHFKEQAAQEANAVAGSKLATMFDNKGGFKAVCEYITWAFTESIPLNDKFTEDSGGTLESAMDQCKVIRKVLSQQYNNLERDHLQGISTNDLRWNLANRVTTWINQQDIANKVTPPASIAAQVEWINHNHWLTTTAGSEAPSYIMFHTDEENLSLIAQSLVIGNNMEPILPLGPSSTIVLEFHDDDVELTVKAFVDDMPVALTSCGAGATCSALGFVGALNQTVLLQNVTAACEATSSQTSGTLKFD